MNAEETVAPDREQSNLVLRKLEDLLKNNQVTPKLEQETGMSREQMEQFVRKFKGAPKAEPGKGREIQIKPGESPKYSPNRTLPGLNAGSRVTSKTVRDRDGVVEDQIRDNVEGARFQVPPELRPGYEAYMSSLSRSKVLNPTRSAPAAKSGSGGN